MTTTATTALNACTIVSANYLAFARVLARSFRDHHRQGRFFVLLVDRNDGRIDTAAEPFELIEVESLDNLPERDGFLFKYSLLECNTAVKPYFLEHLLEVHGLERLVYLDPDIWVTHPLDQVAARLEEHSVVLTPHLTAPIDDGAHPDELAILRAGAYNLGFIALRGDATARALLAWWQDRLFDRCVERVAEGLFVDQKWIDLVPGLFGAAVHVLADRGHNVAYWNLHDRPLTLTPEGARISDRPLVFFHFSGIDPEHLQPVSKHQDRYTLDQLGDAATLYRRYARAVLDAGHRQARPWPYAFACFDNGARIPDLARRLYLDLGPRRQRFGNPFAAAGDDSFFAWLNQPRRGARRPPYLSRLLHHLYRTRPDLVRGFPDVEGTDFADFSAWLEGFGRHELKLDEVFLAAVHRDSRASLLTIAGLRRRLRNRLKRAYHSPQGIAARRALKRLLGHRRARAWRDRLRPPAPEGSAATTPVSRTRLALPAAVERPGVNVVGYLQAETGMGQAARALAAALDAAGVPTSLHSLDLNVLARSEDRTFTPAVSDFPYGVNLLVVNADQVLPVYQHLGGEVFAGRVNVGLWLWELETFPARWQGAFDLLHEIWTPSTFCVDSIGAVAPLPVRRVPLPVTMPAAPAHGRAHFGLRDGTFVFLFTFSFLSYAERKNPLAVVRAFRRAFTPEDDVRLVLKTSQTDFAPDARQALDAAIGDARVTVIDRYLARAETDALTAAADAYVSLHRAEGFGLTVAEAMAAGKPVIATPYAGVTDFFDLNNGLPVRYRLVTLERAIGPYPAGARWAEPDVEHAAERMRELYQDRARAAAIGERARRDVTAVLGVEAVARLVRARFDQLVARVDRQQVGRWL